MTTWPNVTTPSWVLIRSRCSVRIPKWKQKPLLSSLRNCKTEEYIFSFDILDGTDNCWATGGFCNFLGGRDWSISCDSAVVLLSFWVLSLCALLCNEDYFSIKQQSVRLRSLRRNHEASKALNLGPCHPVGSELERPAFSSTQQHELASFALGRNGLVAYQWLYTRCFCTD